MSDEATLRTGLPAGARPDDLRRYCCEFIGTFSLVFFAAGAVVVDAKMGGTLGAIGPGLISGLIITVVIYTFGHVSGAHVNPALSIAAALIGHLDWRLVPGYALAQLAGSVLAGMCLLWALGDYGAMGANLPNAAIGIAPVIAFLIELFLAFLLMWVVAGVGLDKRAHGPFAGVSWLQQDIPGYEEAPGTSTSMHFSGFERGSLVGRAGYQIMAAPDAYGGDIRPFGRVAYNAEAEDDGIFVTAGSNRLPGRFTMQGFVPPGEYWSADVGVNVAMDDRVNIGVAYTGYFTERHGARYSFSAAAGIAF